MRKCTVCGKIYDDYLLNCPQCGSLEAFESEYYDEDDWPTADDEDEILWVEDED